MSSSFKIIILSTILFLIDVYFYQAISVVIKNTSILKRNVVFYCFWGFSILTLIVFIFTFLTNSSSFELPKFFKVYVVAFFVMIIISKLIGSLFIGIDDLIRFFRWIFSYFSHLFPSNNNELTAATNKISRSTFLNQIAVSMAVIPFATFVYGMAKGAFNYKVHKHKVVLPKLPSSFNGFKIVQISDIHAGSFISTSHLEDAVKIILEQKPDIIFFTGDLVNNIASEMEPFMEVFKKVKAPMGVYSTLGNHDYGDYVTWDNQDAKLKNLNDLKLVHKDLGWHLLMNEHVVLKKEVDEIVLLGIENWGGNLNFPKYGNMPKAYQNTEKYPVKLLLSHDPSHWNMQVKKEFKDIDITFSGHTHGFQFGIEIPGWIKWSPSQFVYKQWAGLYQEGKQYLHVNRGLGFLGYPGRVGISPEITVMELFNS